MSNITICMAKDRKAVQGDFKMPRELIVLIYCA